MVSRLDLLDNLLEKVKKSHDRMLSLETRNLNQYGVVQDVLVRYETVIKLLDLVKTLIREEDPA